VINNEEQSKILNCITIEPCLEKEKVSNTSNNTKSLNLYDSTSSFSNMIIKSDSEKTKSEWSAKSISHSQNNANNNKRKLSILWIKTKIFL
jgi:hypothetical protein